MKAEEILNLERGNSQCINLIRDSKFWQAWELSAFYFHRLFRPFKINARYFKNISADMVYLGFPDTLIEKLRIECSEKGFQWNVVSENHYQITGLPEISDFKIWKNSVLGAKDKTKVLKEDAVSFSENEIPENKQGKAIPQNALMLAYREIYDYALDICKRTGKFYRNYRFGLGDRLRDESMEILETIQLAVQGIENLDIRRIQRLLVRARIELRLLLDLKQLNEKQWIFVNGKIETIMKILRLGSLHSTMPGESRSEFSNPLPAQALPNSKLAQSRQTSGKDFIRP